MRALGCLPTQDTIVLERFFDEAGGMQLVIHSPFGSRINRAWGLALRKRFCRKFNFELQAAATEDSDRAVAVDQRTASRWTTSRATCIRQRVARRADPGAARRADVRHALALDRRRRRSRCRASAAARRCRRSSQRMDAEDLLAAVFPDQVACAENLVGEREIPDHPLVAPDASHDCLHEAMDIDGLERLLRGHRVRRRSRSSRAT